MLDQRNNTTEDKVKIIQDLINHCVVFAASDMCKDGALEEPFVHFH